MRAKAILLSVSLATATLYPAAARADDCASLIMQAEQKNSIPKGLLLAVALTESGLKGQPNPWALNIAGRSYHGSGFNDVARVIQTNLSKGIKSIDVGCMQINLKHHGHKFASFTDLLHSPTNVAYGAWYLAHNAQRHGSWYEGVMSYHNKTNQSRRRWYGCLVWNNWIRVTGANEHTRRCGGAPSGSSVASSPSPPSNGIRLVGYSAPTASQNFMPDNQPRTPARGRMELYYPTADGKMRLFRGQEADPRANAFTPVRPIDWSERADPSETSVSQPVPATENDVRVAAEFVVQPAEVGTQTKPKNGFHQISAPAAASEDS